jgi:hypothetical protein
MPTWLDHKIEKKKTLTWKQQQQQIAPKYQMKYIKSH